MMNLPMIQDREFFESLLRHGGLSRARALYDALLSNPIWWTCSKTAKEVYDFQGIRNPKLSRDILSGLRKKSNETKSFLFQTKKNRIHFCVPLLYGERVVGYFGVSGLKREAAFGTLDLLAQHVELAVEACHKGEELKRLSATIRPRAVALSTVHTVHRIINSTLNLDELLSRLAHLTAQVLRSSRCEIYLAEKFRSSRLPENHGTRPHWEKVSFVCKARAGYPKNRSKRIHRVASGSNAVGWVGKTARIALERNFICIPLIDEDVIGVIKVSNKKDGKEFTHFDREILATLAEEAVIAIKNAQLYEEQKRVTLGTIQSLAVILGTRIKNLVAPEVFLRLALKMAEELRLGEEEVQALHYATLLKDTAKIGIPDEILKKPAKLTGEEYRLIRQHPVKGAKIVQSFESLKPVVPIILYSREKYDGTGYPKGLKGDKIPIGARILSVINAFEAIIMGRPYRDRATFKEALEEIAKNSGTQFDPKVTQVFMRVIRREGFRRLLGRR